jgi:2'-5' RNA ligase
MQERLRTFAAFEIDADQKEAIGRFAEQMRARPGGSDLRWVRPENLHMTVRFFGGLDRKQLAKARTAISGLDGNWDKLELRLGRLGAFPSMRRPQVLWLGIEDPESRLANLAAEVDRAIRLVGFGPADKKFIGHLTLARVGKRRRAPDMEQLTAGLTLPDCALTICAITLFWSDLQREGPRYTPLEIAHPRSGSVSAGPGRSADGSSSPPRARRTGQDPENRKEGETSNG